HHIHELMKGVSFDIEFDSLASNQIQQDADVTAPNVAAIRARMHGDALRTRRQRETGDVYHTRDVERARIAQQRDLVDVDAEPGHICCISRSNWRVCNS